ncbi:MAG TPA: DNA topoisomerase IB [Casimicrobiaceae bacterium]|nr:DNA topoisomerase IB [Casimicrobiaceae bacterium]
MARGNAQAKPCMEPQTSAAAAGLVYVADSVQGIRRVRRGKRFAYISPDGRRVTDPAELDRIGKLAIPPAYEDVWICSDPRGHLQATGRDARGRKQYRYHPSWRQVRDAQKFERMPAFAEALPRLRRRVRQDLAREGMPREKVLAIVVSLLDATRLRIGNDAYARENASYGLTTLKNRHVQFAGDGKLVLRFVGKGGAAQEIAVGDKRIARLVRHCQELPGQRLFQYVDDAGETRPIDSDQVNAYLKECMGDDFTAKDFRTWSATLRALQLMHSTPLPERPSERALAARIVEVVREVAAGLRNTPAVCRKSYINPVVFDSWRTGALHGSIRESLRGAPRRAERVVAAFLRHHAALKRRESRARPRGTPRAPMRPVHPSTGAATAARAYP